MIGAQIDERRRELKMTQEHLAGLAGISRTYLSDIERGLRNLSVMTLVKLANAMDSSASGLLARAENLHRESTQTKN